MTNRLILVGALSLILGTLFWCKTDEVVFSNDFPVSQGVHNAYQGAAVLGDWEDLNHLGETGRTQGGGPAQLGTICGLVNAPELIAFFGLLNIISFISGSRKMILFTLISTAFVPIIAMVGLYNRHSAWGEALGATFGSASITVFMFALMLGIGSLPIEKE